MIDEIQKTLGFLRSGKVILYPTDTIWGIGCDATLSKPVEKIYKIKQRYEKKSMIVLLDDPAKLPLYVSKVPKSAYDLIESYQEPLTVIYSQAKNIAKSVIAEDGTIAIRIVRDEFCRRLIAGLGKPLVSTSANISGQPAPIMFNKIPEEIRNSVDYIVDYHREEVIRTKPSTIIRLHENGEFDVIRK
jgi:L-threonylcarbamoyladenylate synthase